MMKAHWQVIILITKERVPGSMLIVIKKYTIFSTCFMPMAFKYGFLLNWFVGIKKWNKRYHITGPANPKLTQITCKKTEERKLHSVWGFYINMHCIFCFGLCLAGEGSKHMSDSTDNNVNRCQSDGPQPGPIGSTSSLICFACGPAMIQWGTLQIPQMILGGSYWNTTERTRCVQWWVRIK